MDFPRIKTPGLVIYIHFHVALQCITKRILETLRYSIVGGWDSGTDLKLNAIIWVIWVNSPDWSDFYFGLIQNFAGLQNLKNIWYINIFNFGWDFGTDLKLNRGKIWLIWFNSPDWSDLYFGLMIQNFTGYIQLRWMRFLDWPEIKWRKIRLISSSGNSPDWSVFLVAEDWLLQSPLPCWIALHYKTLRISDT